MSNDLQGLMDAAAGPLGQGLGAATVLALAVWGFTAVVRQAPAVLRQALWRGVLAAFWLAPLAVFGANALHLPTLAVASPRPAPVMVQTVSELPLPQREQVAVSAVPGTERLSRPADPPIPNPQPLIPNPQPLTPLPVLLLALWLGGAGLGGLALLRDLWSVRRLRHTMWPLAALALSERVAHWAAQLGLRRPVRLAESEAVGVPVLVGLWRPALLLPPNFAARTDAAAQEAALVHELAHLRQGDLGTLALARLTCVLLWWHPLVWLTAARLRATAEEVCDDWAVALTATRQGYAEALVQLAEAATAGAGGLACVRRGRSLVRRVQRILSETRTPVVHVSRGSRWVLALGTVALLLAVGGLRLTSESTASAATAGTKAVTSGAEGRTPEEARPVVEGIVTDAATGKPVAGARIFLFRLKVKEALQGHNQWVAGKPVVTDAKGQFTLLAESPGVFRLEVQAPNYLSVHTEEFPLRAGEKVSRPVSLQPIPAHLRPGLITGVVKGARDQTPLDVRVRGRGLWVDFDWTAFGPSPSPDWGGGSGRPSFTTSSDLPSSGEYDLSASLETDAEGRFIFSFPSGNYTLRFTLPDGRGQEFPDRAIYPGAKTELTITPGPLPPDTEPSLFPSHPLTESLQLTVLRPEGTPLANRRIYLFQYTVNEAGQVVGWPAGGGSFEKTDERGCVDFPTNPGTHGWWVKTADFAEGRVPPMTITAGQPARATVRLPGPAVKLVIRVRANDGQPIPHALAVAARLNAFEGSPGGVRSITASSDFWKFGFVERFLDGLGPGLVEEMSKAGEIGELLGLMQRGHYVAITDGRGEAALPDLEPGTYFVGAAAQGFAREAPIRLNVGERGARREFILRPLARLIGVVRRPDGHPLANVELTVKGQTRAGEPWWEKIYTDSRGRYTLAVAEDTVRLLFQRNGWVPAEIKPAGLTPGEKKTIDIPMDRGATVKGSVIATGLGATLPPGLIVKAIQGWGRSQWTRVADDGTYVLTGLEVGPCHLEVRLGGSGALDEVEVTIREPRQVLGASMMIGGPAVRMER